MVVTQPGQRIGRHVLLGAQRICEVPPVEVGVPHERRQAVAKRESRDNRGQRDHGADEHGTRGNGRPPTTWLQGEAEPDNARKGKAGLGGHLRQLGSPYEAKTLTSSGSLWIAQCSYS